VDDDTASRRMLEKIIIEGELGVIIGEADSGVKAIPLILSTHPDVVLIDLLMPGLDGIETVEQLKIADFRGQFIMISQIVNKEMVGEAYEKGVEFFIHKPINRIEVNSILKKTAEQFRLKNSLIAIRESLAHMEPARTMKKQKSVKDIVFSILNGMGITGESGSNDIVSIIEILMKRSEKTTKIPPLTDLYEAVARITAADDMDIKKQSKAIEQRIRRTILTAVNNLASMGTIDYTNPEFEYYAPRYFDFQEIRLQMNQIRDEIKGPTKVKTNVRKFLQMLYIETEEKYNQS